MHCQAYQEKRCQSCDLMDFSYEKTIETKENSLKQLFPELIDHNYSKPFYLSSPFSSRNKLKLSARRLNDEICFGIYDQNQAFKFLEDCPLHKKNMNPMLDGIRKFFKKAKLQTYNLQTQKGELKGIILTSNPSEDECLLRIILRSKESVDRLKKFLPQLTAEFPTIKVVTCVIQPKHIAMLDGEESIYLTEKKWISHSFRDVQLIQGERSFFQVSPEVTETLYSQITTFIKEQNIKNILDLFCKIRAFSLYSSP